MKRKNYNTVGKSALLDYLAQHPDRQYSVEELCITLHGNAQSAKSSLYRQLAALCNEKKVRMSRQANGTCSLYQFASSQCERHLHEKCVRCGRVEHLDCHVSKEFFDHLLKEHGFEVFYGQSMLYGLCAACRAGGNEHA